MNNQKQLIRFIATSAVLYLAWVLLEQWMIYNNALDNWLSHNVAFMSAVFLSFIGYDTAAQGTTLLIDSQAMVYIGNPCNGLVLMVLFTGFIISFPGPVRSKMLYIPVGIVAIYLLNVVRVMALALTALYQRQALDFNHKYTFAFVVYACIFGMWMLWVKKYSGINLAHVQNAAPEKQDARIL